MIETHIRTSPGQRSRRISPERNPLEIPSLEDLLQIWLKRNRCNHRILEEKAKERFMALIEPAIQETIYYMSVQHRILFIKVNSPAARQDLQLRLSSILEAINAQLHEKVLDDIRLK